MKTDFIELPVETLPGFESPAVTALHVQNDDSLLCGLSFANPCLVKITEATGAMAPEDMGLEDSLGKGVLGVMNGLRANSSGDTAFAVLHEGFAPGFVRKLSGGDVSGKVGAELMSFLETQDGGLGVAVRHSVVQITEGQFSVRRLRDPGALLDAAHIGDFVFGLFGTSIWREPYLNSEKRETLRKDLSKSTTLHRDNVGNFWFLGQGGRLLRMSQTDIKAKPTPLKLPNFKEGSAFDLSAPSLIDEWLYGTCNDSKTLFRVRINSVSNEEELQVVAEYPNRITGMTFLAHESQIASRSYDIAKPVDDAAKAIPDGVQPLASATLVVALEGSEGSEVFAGEVVPSDDPELQSPLPKLRSRGRVPGIRTLTNLTSDGTHIWGGEGRLGSGLREARKPKVVRITEL